MKSNNVIYKAIKFSTTEAEFSFLSGEWVINNDPGEDIWSYNGNVITAQQNTNPGSRIYHPIEELVVGNDYVVSFDVQYFEQTDSAPALNFALGDSTNSSQRSGVSGPRGGGSTESISFTLTCYSKKIEFLNNRYVVGVPPFSGIVSNISITPVE